MLLPNTCIPWTAESHCLNIQYFPIASKYCIRKQNKTGKYAFAEKMQRYKQKKQHRYPVVTKIGIYHQ